MAPNTRAQSSMERAMGPSLSMLHASVMQPPGYGGLAVERLLLERGGPPGGRVAGVGDEVLRSPGDAVQRSAVAPGGNLAIGLLRLLQRQFLGERDDAVQGRIVLLEA